MQRLWQPNTEKVSLLDPQLVTRDGRGFGLGRASMWRDMPQASGPGWHVGSMLRDSFLPSVRSFFDTPNLLACCHFRLLPFPYPYLNCT
jgi:hypothetical protein